MSPESGLRTARSGFSLMEVLICLGILTFGLLPIVTMYHSTTKKGGLSEFHVFFQSRATRILEYYSSFNYDVFKLALMTQGKTVKLDIKSKIADPPLPVEYARMLDDNKYDETCTIEFADREQPDLIVMTVDIRWKFPLDSNEHSYKLARLFCRPDLTLSDNGIEFKPDTP